MPDLGSLFGGYYNSPGGAGSGGSGDDYNFPFPSGGPPQHDAYGVYGSSEWPKDKWTGDWWDMYYQDILDTLYKRFKEPYGEMEKLIGNAGIYGPAANKNLLGWAQRLKYPAWGTAMGGMQGFRQQDLEKWMAEMQANLQLQMGSAQQGQDGGSGLFDILAELAGYYLGGK